MRFEKGMGFVDALKTCEARNSSLPIPNNEAERIQLMKHGETWINIMVNSYLSEPVFANWQHGYRAFMNRAGELEIVNSEEEKPFTCVKEGILPKWC